MPIRNAKTMGLTQHAAAARGFEILVSMEYRLSPIVCYDMGSRPKLAHTKDGRPKLTFGKGLWDIGLMNDDGRIKWIQVAARSSLSSKIKRIDEHPLRSRIPHLFPNHAIWAWETVPRDDGAYRYIEAYILPSGKWHRDHYSFTPALNQPALFV